MWGGSKTPPRSAIFIKLRISHCLRVSLPARADYLVPILVAAVGQRQGGSGKRGGGVVVNRKLENNLIVTQPHQFFFFVFQPELAGQKPAVCRSHAKGHE